MIYFYKDISPNIIPSPLLTKQQLNKPCMRVIMYVCIITYSLAIVCVGTLRSIGFHNYKLGY